MPGWPTLVEQIKLADASPVIVRTHPEDGFLLHADTILAAITPRTRGIVINSPGNPTGALMEEQEMARLADAVKAKQEGHAALERALGETAARLNLSNVARVLEGNPALMNLRLMQSRTAAQHAGNTLVIGVPGGFVPLKPGAKAANAESNEVT